MRLSKLLKRIFHREKKPLYRMKPMLEMREPRPAIEFFLDERGDFTPSKDFAIFGEYDIKEVEKKGYFLIGTPVTMYGYVNALTEAVVRRRVEKENPGLEFDACVVHQSIGWELDESHDSVIDIPTLEVYALKKKKDKLYKSK